MAISVTLTVSPAAPPAGGVVTATYAVSGLSAGTPSTLETEAVIGGTEYEVTETFTPVTAAVSYAVPACPGLTFTPSAATGSFTATVPAGGAVSGAQAVSGSVTVGAAPPVAVSASVTLPGAPVAPPPSGTVPYPPALATGHALLEQYLPADLYAWRYMPGTTTPVTNGSGVSENPASPRNVSVATDGGLSVLRLGVTSAADCGVIQSPGQYPTSSGVIEALVKFSGFTNASGHFFAAWASFWLYGEGWPANGEVDSVETQYGNSYVSYHYGSGSSSQATTDPWTYPAKTVQLQPKNSTSAPAAPNILPDAWTYVTLAFGKAAGGGYYCDVYYNGALYCTISGSYVTGAPMWITAGTGFGASVLGSSQAPYDQPGNIELQYVRVFS